MILLRKGWNFCTFLLLGMQLFSPHAVNETQSDGLEIESLKILLTSLSTGPSPRRCGPAWAWRPASPSPSPWHSCSTRRRCIARTTGKVSLPSHTRQLLATLDLTTCYVVKLKILMNLNGFFLNKAYLWLFSSPGHDSVISILRKDSLRTQASKVGSNS